ncbi:MAG: ABC transporter substrate-binding protein [Rhodocyclaceae bacterium]|nr:ABC transporter substrate-binding protein [Rhodocyclaceae bacterium]
MLNRVIRALAIAAPLLFSAASPAVEGVTDDRIVLGQSAALSGPAEALGREMRLGAQLYFDQVNASGGVLGRRIELVSLDDGYEPDRTIANTMKLIEHEKVFALFGYVGTPTSKAALPIFTQEGVPFIGAFTGAELLRDPFNRLIFNIRASYYDETAKIVDSFTALGMSKVAVFYQNDAYGQAGLAGVERAMQAKNLKLVATGTVERNTTDVAAAVKAITAAQPDIVVMISAYRSCAAFIKAMREAGSFANFYNVSFVGSRQLADELGDQGIGVGISQVMPFPWNNTLGVVREYRKLLEPTGNPESFTSMEGYIAAKVMVEGLRRAGRDLTRDKLIAALETMNRFDVGGFDIGFTPKNHAGSRYVDLTIIKKNGKFMH